MEKRKVPFFNYPFVYKSLEKEFLDAFKDVGERGAFIFQRDMEEFEKTISKYTGSKFAFGVANCTDGLIMAVRCSGIGPGDEVIFCSHTFVATAAAIHFAGAIPVPVECGFDHLIDPEAIEKAITPRTKAIMPTHLNGRTCDMDSILRIASKHGLLVIEDAAQALGSTYKGKKAGTFGVAGAISFYPAKNLGALGDAGIVLTNDEEMAEKFYCMRDHGRSRSGEIIMWGLNSRLDNLQATFLNCRFKKYDSIVRRRREIASIYHEHLSSIKQLVLPPPPVDEGVHFDVFQNYEIEAERRDELKSFLLDCGVGTLIQWGGKMVHQHEKLRIRANLPFSDKVSSRMLLLPMNDSLEDEDVIYVSECIRQFYCNI